MSNDKPQRQPTPQEIDEHRRRKERERELERRRLTKSGQPGSGLVDTNETEYDDE